MTASISQNVNELVGEDDVVVVGRVSLYDCGSVALPFDDVISLYYVYFGMATRDVR